MCYNPTVSLLTAIIEFCLSAIIVFKYKFSKTKNYFAVLIFVLGFYQFTEFMLCQSDAPQLWAKIGFITYTFLPAIALHITAKYFKLRLHWSLIYLLPICYGIYAAVTSGFILSGACSTIFIFVHNILFEQSNILLSIAYYLYALYYAGFIIISCAIFIKNFSREKKSKKRIAYLALPLGVILMSVPTFILLIIFPAFQVVFPSALCHFALLLALTAFIGVKADDDHERLIAGK